MAQLEQSITVQTVGTLYITKQMLEEDIARLSKRREDEGRFLKIDEEQAELERLSGLIADTKAQAARDASEILEAARREADRLLSASRQASGRERGELLAQARRDAEILLREANQASAAQRESAEAVYADARRKTSTVDEALGERLATCETREAAIRLKIQELDDREKATGRVESAIDSKRQMLRAGIEALRRVLDDLHV